MPKFSLPNIPISKRQAMIAGGVVVVVLAAFFLIRANIREEVQQGPPVEFSVWGTDSERAVDVLIEGYGGLRSNAAVTYTRIPESDYHDRLLRALARGEGPDVFMLGSRAIRDNLDLLAPANPQQANRTSVRSLFPTTVERDFIIGGEVYALPLEMDTLALLYNRDMFDRAGIVSPPERWEEFRDAVQALRVIDEQNAIVRAGAAVGGTEETVQHAVDILHALMLQNGEEIVNANGTVTLGRGGGAAEALAFYLQFANSGAPHYTWNDAQNESLDALVAGDTAMAFGYYEDVKSIRERAPFLNLGVATFPQVNPAAALTYPRYDGLAVSARSDVPEWGWDFAAYVTTNADVQTQYSQFNETIPALRELIETEFADPDRAVFAEQALTARSWPIRDYDRVVGIFDEVIREALRGRIDASRAVRQAVERMRALYSDR